MKVSQKKKIQVLRKIFKTNIEEFGKYLFVHHLKLETPEFHKDIYNIYTGDKNRVALGAPRGHAKSTITDLVYLAWAIVNKKAKFVLLVSDTYSQAILFLDALKSEFESNDKLKMLYGDLQSDSWSEKEIVVNGIMIKAVGAGMKVRGLKYKEHRPDLIIVDDLENDELVESKARREKLERWFNGALIPSMAKQGKIIVIGTILHYDSLLSKLLDEKQYTEFTKKTYKAINGNEALWPEHLSLQELQKIKDEYFNKGQGYLFYQEYQNDPVSGENRKFRIEKIKYYDEEKLLAKRLNTYITIDRAYSLENTADYTGIVVVSVDIENFWYIRMAERFRGTEKDLIKKMFDLVAYYEPKRVGIEQKAFEYTIKPALDEEMRQRNTFFHVDELKDLGKRKTLRIEGLLPRYDTQTIFFKKDQTDLVDELIMFPKAPHDDLADALAYQLGLAVAPKMQFNKIQAKQPVKSYFRR